MSYLVVFQFLVTEKGHTVVARKCPSRYSESSRVGNSSKRYSFTLALQLCEIVHKRAKILFALICGAWKTRSWLSMAGIRDTARQDNMIGLCLVLVVNGRLKVSVHDDRCWHFISLVGESQPSLLVRQIVLITLIDKVLDVPVLYDHENGFARSEKVVTESALCVSRKVFHSSHHFVVSHDA